jgi:hypothetical protein
MPLTPREIVVVLDVEQDPDAERPGDVPVNHGVVRCRIPAHQLHRCPILLARLG